jgi:hypothetical protein
MRSRLTTRKTAKSNSAAEFEKTIRRGELRLRTDSSHIGWAAVVFDE